MRNGGLGGCRFNFQQRRVAVAGRGGGKAVLFVQIGIPGRKEKEKEKRRRRTIRKKEEIPPRKKEHRVLWTYAVFVTDKKST
jgi:hypothetical protein